MTVTAEDRYQRIRHNFKPSFLVPGKCFYCTWGKSNWRHRTGARCSMCFKYFKHYQLDSSGRCDIDRP